MRKIFPLDEVLSVSTGYLVSDRHIDAVYDLIAHLTGDDGVTTLGIAAASKACAAELKTQFPALENVGTPPWAGSERKVGQDEIKGWVREQVSVVGGTTFSVLGDTVHARDYSFLGN